MKTTRSPQRKVHSVTIAAITKSGHTTKCLNLRPAHRGGRDVLAVTPALVAVRQGRFRPLATYHAPDGTEHILFQQYRHGEPPSLVTESGGKWTEVAANTEVSCAIARRGGFIAMTGQGPLRLSYAESTWTSAPHVFPAPEICIETSETGIITTETAAITVKDVSFDRSSPQIPATGLKSLSQELLDAYRRLSATADDSNLWIQPAIIRYHLIGRGGERVYSSAPTITGCGWQCTSAISADCTKTDTTLTIPPLQLSARTYRLSLSVANGVAKNLHALGITAIEVEATPQIHPVDNNATCAWRIIRQSTSTPVISLTLPGTTDSFASRERRRAATLRNLMARLDSSSQILATLNQPIIDGCTEIQRTPAMTLDEEQRTIESSLTKKVNGNTSDYTGSLLAEISSPNTFTASTATSSGDMVAWGDITPIPATAITISDICTNFSDVSYTGILEVHFRSGRIRRITVSGTRAPSAWASAVSYPDESASALVLFIRRKEGNALRGEMQLSPIAGTRISAHIDNTLSSTNFESWNGEIPEPDSHITDNKRRAGAVVASRLSAPISPLSALEVCHSPIRSLMPALRSQSSWDFSHCHIYAMPQASIHAVSLNASRRLVSATIIDPRGIDRNESATRTSDSIITLHRGQMIRLAASRAETIATVTPFVEIAWDAASETLWALDAESNLTCYSPQGGSLTEISSPANFEHIYSAGNRLWLSDTDELYRPETESEAASSGLRPILWQADTRLPPYSRITILEIGMSASTFYGTVTLRSQNASGNQPPLTLLKMNVSGKINAPVIRRLSIPPRPFVNIEINGMADDDFQLHHIRFNLITN